MNTVLFLLISTSFNILLKFRTIDHITLRFDDFDAVALIPRITLFDK